MSSSLEGTGCMIADTVRQSCALTGGGLHLVPGSHAASCNLSALHLCLTARTATKEAAWWLQQLPLQKVVAEPLLMSLLICVIDRV